MSTQIRVRSPRTAPPVRTRVHRVLSRATAGVAALLLAAGCRDPGQDTGQGAGGRAATTADAAVPTGAEAYGRVCANCHLEHGRGIKSAYRSLVGSPWATGDADRTIAIVLYGVRGPVVDGGVTYFTSMLPYGSGMPMRDEAVAAAVTHVRTSWGNQASAVTAADVARVRARFGTRRTGFTQAELDAMAGAGH